VVKIVTVGCALSQAKNVHTARKNITLVYAVVASSTELPVASAAETYIVNRLLSEISQTSLSSDGERIVAE